MCAAARAALASHAASRHTRTWLGSAGLASAENTTPITMYETATRIIAMTQRRPGTSVSIPGRGPRPARIRRVPFERVACPVHDVPAAAANRDDRGQDPGVESVRRQPRAEPAVDRRHKAYLRVVAAEVDRIGSDNCL